MTAVYYFHASLISHLLIAASTGQDMEVSLDLNLSRERVSFKDRNLVLPTGERIPLDALVDFKDLKNKVFTWCQGEFSTVEVRADGYYKLVPTDSAPTLEIDGIKMHRSKDIDPLEDARVKTQHVVSPGGEVLDTCGGLGYSAIHCIKAGARSVVSVEKNPHVLEIRAQNPWSHTVEAEKIRWVHEDVNLYIQTLDAGRFDGVIHDPPRITSATGDLYGQVFYNELHRILKKGGKLFHYTGSPKKIKHGDRFVTNAMKRLEKAGFQSVTFNEYLQGIEAVKPAVPFPF